jgi:hypothetical protein
MYVIDEEYRDIIEFCFNLYDGEFLHKSSYSMIMYSLQNDRDLDFTKKELLTAIIIIDAVNIKLLNSEEDYPKSYMICFKYSQKFMKKYNKWKDFKSEYYKI